MPTWLGRRIDVIRSDPSGNWLTIRLLEKCSWFDKGEVLAVSRWNVRMPLLKGKRTPIR